METPEVEQHLTATWPPVNWRELTVLVAVSGGTDSVALLRALHAQRLAGAGRLVVAHYNHRWRDESDAEAQFVDQLCRQLGLPCVEGHPRNSPTRRDEATARRLRYEFLRAEARRLGARYVAMAHTADDQVETILHRILRGTGVAGLSGMPRVRPLSTGCGLIRPLLGVWRNQLRAYLEGLRQPACEDPSNSDLRYRRNRIRHELLPHLAKNYNPRVAEAILRLGQLAADAEGALDAAVEQLHRQTVRSEPTGVLIDCPPLAQADRHLVRRLLIAVWIERHWPRQAMQLGHWEALAQLAQAEDFGHPVRRTLPGAIRATRHDSWLRLDELPQAKDSP
ncbi:MAG: tRNA lysidine(34) synthetase TilS [Pirellulaceae bacterium]|nr:tRNA lysidine(34) synthetase TilS [Pirellulaceae bacterium]